MNISIFGLGYVGCVSMGCFANLNHRVVGVDTNQMKIDMINKGIPTILEPGLEKLIKNGFKKRLIKATGDYKNAINETDISFICIGTPGNKDGSLNFTYLLNGIKQIAEGLKYKKDFHTIVIRSTVLPGTFKKIVSIVGKISKKKLENDFCVVMNPEFLREGTAVEDFMNPPINIIGTESEKAFKTLKKIYSFNKSSIFKVDEKAAEMIKLVNNTFHGLKISFANEIGNLCKELGIDSNTVLNLLCEDKKLNISDTYLKPGFAYGGSCLPKDIRAINSIAIKNKLKMPLITSSKYTNELQKARTYEKIKSFGVKKISIWGLSFKIGTDDLRESPIIDVINMLLKEGYDIKVFDQNVNLEKIIGSNLEYIRRKVPLIKKIWTKDFDSLIKHSNLLVINSFDNKLIKKIENIKNIYILDLMNISGKKKFRNYTGLCW